MIQTAAGLGMSLIAGEHFFSTMLSSPWTTEKFAQSEEDKAKVRQYYMIATVLSLVTAYLIGRILKQSWPLIATAILSGLYIVIYERALRKSNEIG